MRRHPETRGGPVEAAGQCGIRGKPKAQMGPCVNSDRREAGEHLEGMVTPQTPMFPPKYQPAAGDREVGGSWLGGLRLPSSPTVTAASSLVLPVCSPHRGEDTGGLGSLGRNLGHRGQLGQSFEEPHMRPKLTVQHLAPQCDPWPPAWASPRNLRECRISGPTPDSRTTAPVCKQPQ